VQGIRSAAVRHIKAVGDDFAHDPRIPLTWVRTRLERSLEYATTLSELGGGVHEAFAGIDQALDVIVAQLRSVANAERWSQRPLRWAIRLLPAPGRSPSPPRHKPFMSKPFSRDCPERLPLAPCPSQHFGIS
jgi:hypothetical protein